MATIRKTYALALADQSTKILTVNSLETDIEFKDISEFNVIDIFYQLLWSNTLGGSLKKGQLYRINDYRTKNLLLPVSNNSEYYIHSSSIEPLIVLATSTSSLSEIAYSELYPQDIIYYDVNKNAVYSTFPTESILELNSEIPTQTGPLENMAVGGEHRFGTDTVVYINQVETIILADSVTTETYLSANKDETFNVITYGSGGTIFNFPSSSVNLYDNTYVSITVQYYPALESRTGWITRRIDPNHNIDILYDWRGVKYRRWKLLIDSSSVESYNPATEYVMGSTVASESIIYVCVTGSLTGGDPIDSSMYWYNTLANSYNGKYVLPSNNFSNGYSDDTYYTSSEYIDCPLFCNSDGSSNGNINLNNIYNYISSNRGYLCSKQTYYEDKIDFNVHFSTGTTQITNNYILASTYQNTTLSTFSNNTIFGKFYTNICNTFYDNNIIASCTDNRFVQLINNNITTITGATIYQIAYNTITHLSNAISNAFKYNILTSNNVSNIIATSFSYNIINCLMDSTYFYVNNKEIINNKISTPNVTAEYITAYSEFSNNEINSDFKNSILSGSFKNNKIVSNAFNEINSITNFNNNTIYTDLINITFETASHVSNNYDCTIITPSGSTEPILLYYDLTTMAYTSSIIL